MSVDSDVFADALEAALDDADLFGSAGACPTLHEPGNPRLIVISGENAGGKSFFVKALNAFMQEDAPKQVEWMPVSMGMRTSPGMHRVFMFGEESNESTGRISLKAVLGGLRTCQSREKSHVLLLDEPDIGLAESYQAALGQMLAGFAADMPAHTRALIIVSHSRSLVSALMALGPTCIRVGDDLRSTAEWIREGDLPKTPADIEALGTKAMTRMRAISAVMNARRAERRAGSPAP